MNKKATPCRKRKCQDTKRQLETMRDLAGTRQRIMANAARKLYLMIGLNPEDGGIVQAVDEVMFKFKSLTETNKLLGTRCKEADKERIKADENAEYWEREVELALEREREIYERQMDELHGEYLASERCLRGKFKDLLHFMGIALDDAVAERDYLLGIVHGFKAVPTPEHHFDRKAFIKEYRARIIDINHGMTKKDDEEVPY